MPARVAKDYLRAPGVNFRRYRVYSEAEPLIDVLKRSNDLMNQFRPESEQVGVGTGGLLLDGLDALMTARKWYGHYRRYQHLRLMRFQSRGLEVHVPNREIPFGRVAVPPPWLLKSTTRSRPES